MTPALVAALAGAALAAPAAPPCRDARAVDWANHAHPLLLADRLVDGAAEVRVNPADRPLPEVYRWTLRGVYYGDLDGDGCDEALTWLAHSYEGTTPRGGPAGGQGFVWRLEPDGEALLGGVYGAAAATPRFEGAAIVIGAVRWAYTPERGFEPYPYAVPGAPTPGKPSAPPPAPPTSKPPPTACRDLRAVDWKNHAFPFGGPDALRDGHAEYREYAALGGPHDTNTWALRDVLHGDLDGDGCDEAVAVIRATYAAPNGSSRAWVEAWVWRGTPSGEVSVGHVDAAEDAVVRVTGGRLHVGDDRWRLRDGRLVEE